MHFKTEILLPSATMRCTQSVRDIALRAVEEYSSLFEAYLYTVFVCSKTEHKLKIEIYNVFISIQFFHALAYESAAFISCHILTVKKRFPENGTRGSFCVIWYFLPVKLYQPGIFVHRNNFFNFTFIYLTFPIPPLIHNL